MHLLCRHYKYLCRDVAFIICWMWVKWFPVIMAWRILNLYMEETAFKYGGYQQKYWISSRRQPTRGSPPEILRNVTHSLVLDEFFGMNSSNSCCWVLCSGYNDVTRDGTFDWFTVVGMFPFFRLQQTSVILINYFCLLLWHATLRLLSQITLFLLCASLGVESESRWLFVTYHWPFDITNYGMVSS
jgi:hypothetical protein